MGHAYCTLGWEQIHCNGWVGLHPVQLGPPRPQPPGGGGTRGGVHAGPCGVGSGSVGYVCSGGGEAGREDLLRGGICGT